MSSHPNRSFTGGRLPIAAIVLSVLLCAPNAHAQAPPPLPQMCGDGVFYVDAPSGRLTLPKGCSMYLLIVSDHGRNTQMNELTFYPLAKWVAENGGYVHWAWWNNLLREYMAGPLGSGNQATPTYSYPGLVERGWARDGAPPVVDFIRDLFSTDVYTYGATPFPETNAAFVNDAREFLRATRTANQEALIFAVGHGFGAGSLNHVFEGLSDADVDLVGLIDPVGPENTPGALRSNLNTYRGSQWRAQRIFRGYRQADCVRNPNVPLLCKNHASSIFSWPEYHCEKNGRRADTESGWLSSPPALPSRVPFLCKGPIVDEGVIYRIFRSPSNIRQVVRRSQPESRVPINPGQSPTPLLTCRDKTHADPILKAIVDEGAAHPGALPVPESLQGALHATLDCNPDDGHDELIGDRGISQPIDFNVLNTNCEFDFTVFGLHLSWWSAIATNVCDWVDGALVKSLVEHAARPGNAPAPVHHQTERVPYGSLVTGLSKFGLTDVQEYLASIGRPTPTEPWPACPTCFAGASVAYDARNLLPPDMLNSSNTEKRRQALISMATPGPWPFQPAFPEMCLVCGELIEIAANMLDANTTDDTASPITSAQLSPGANDNGWTTGDTTLVLSATDNPGGSGVRQIAVSTSGAESGSAVHIGAFIETSVTTEGITTVTFAARDNTGNEESPAQTLVVKIDKTNPMIESVAAPPPNAFGWNKTDVTVSFSASDTLSGLAELSPTAPVVVTTEGQDQEIPGYAIDVAGNELSAGPKVSIDKTAPEIVPITDIAPNVYGWNNTDVAVSFDASDALSDIASSSPDVLVSTEGSAQTITGTAEDRAGNSASESAVLNIDRTPPQITAATKTAPNSNGWFGGDVSVSFTASDALSGLAFTTPETLVSSEGAKQDIVGTAKDKADNSATASVIVNIDKTAPQITAASKTAPNANGWYGGDVVVSFAASDALSGLAFSSPDVVVSTEGAAQEISGTATDKADHTANASVIVNIDKTAPVIALSSRTPANAAGWNNTDVSLTWQCTDSLSGPVVNQVAQSLSAEGAAQNAIGTCADLAGHTASNTQSGINIDKTSPTSQITTPANGAVYVLNGIVNAAYGCADALSGVSACVGPVAPGAAVDTATVGDKTFTVNAADAAGNQSAASHSYTVQYAFSGFSNPIVAMPAVNTANAGKTVPVKYSLRDVNNAVISDLTSFVSLISAPVACDTNVPTAAAEETDGAGSTTIHFDSGQFIYNWKTQAAWEGTCRVLQLELKDGTRHLVAFQFK